MGNTRNLGDLLNTDSTIATADVADGGITTAKLADTAVTTAKITDANITTAKLASNAVTTAKITDGNISTAKLADDAITQAKIGADAVGTTELANDVVINTSGAITTTGAFTSKGIDDNADATAITITSDEAVGIGKSLTPNNYSGYQSLTIGGSDATTGSVLDFEDSDGNIEAEISGTAGRLYLDADPNGATAGGFIHLGVDGNQVLKLDDSRNVTITDGNLVIGTSGKGIDFSAQSGTNNVPTGDGTANPTSENEVLQYYEHGTFSPKPTASGCTFSYQGAGNAYGSGHYTRIGDMVFIDINLDSGSGVTGSTGNAITVTNLPFSGNTGCTLNGGQYFYRRVSDSSYPFIACQQYGTAISFLQMPAQGVWRDLPASQVSFVDHRWKIAGCYHIGSI